MSDGIAYHMVRSPYNYDREKASFDSGVPDEGVPSKTIQSEKDNADINVIVKRFGVTGQLPQGIRVPQFGDFEQVDDFHSAMQAIRQAEESFMALPSAVRNRFQNDPQEFMEFCSNEENIDELRKMGLAIPKAPDILPPDSGSVPRETKAENKDGSSESGVAGGSASAGKSEGAAGGK